MGSRANQELSLSSHMIQRAVLTITCYTCMDPTRFI